MPLFACMGDRFVPTTLARSPWDPGHQHGGPSLALVVGEAERVLPEGASPARIESDILRPIPMTPLTVSARVVRPGRRVALAEVTVSDEDGPLLLSRVWSIRERDPLDLPPPPSPLPDPPPPPESLPGVRMQFTDFEFFGDALDQRLAAGSLEEPGPATVWFRLRGPVLDCEPSSPVQRLAAVADSGNGISWSVPFREFLFVNIDLSIYLLRDPVGEWFALDSVTRLDPSGRGIAETRLFDEAGYVGRSQQALFVDRR